MAGPNFALLPDPDTLQFTAWAAIAAEQLASFGLPSPLDEAQWRTWAVTFIDGSVPGSPAPSPYGFDSWQQWAKELIGTLT